MLFLGINIKQEGYKEYGGERELSKNTSLIAIFNKSTKNNWVFILFPIFSDFNIIIVYSLGRNG